MSDVMQLEQETNYFGSCPECGQADRYLNFYRDHWFVCDEHEVRWWVGSNVFSSWRDEEEEDWEANGRLLMGYREVEPSRSARRYECDGYAESEEVDPVNNTEKLEREVDTLDREAREALDRLADKREELERERERNRPEESLIFPRWRRRPWK